MNLPLEKSATQAVLNGSTEGIVTYNNELKKISKDNGLILTIQSQDNSAIHVIKSIKANTLMCI